MATATLAPLQHCNPAASAYQLRSSFDVWSGISPTELSAEVCGTSHQAQQQQQRRGHAGRLSLQLPASGFEASMQDELAALLLPGETGQLVAALEQQQTMLLQQQQQELLLLQQEANAACEEEQDIDAQIGQLLQLKQLLRNKQHVDATQQRQAALLDALTAAVAAEQQQPVDISASALFAPAAMQPAAAVRHSIDIGGLAQQLAALEMHTGAATSTASLMSPVGGASLCLDSFGLSYAATSLAPPATDIAPAMLQSPQALGGQVPGAALALQSALYASATPPPASAACLTSPVAAPLPPLAPRASIDVRRASIDVRQSMDLCSIMGAHGGLSACGGGLMSPIDANTVYGGCPSPVGGIMAGQQEAAGWDFAARRASVDVCGPMHLQQQQGARCHMPPRKSLSASAAPRASMDCLRCATPGARVPPCRSASTLTTASSGGSSISSTGRCSPPNSARGAGRNRRHSVDRAPMAAPKWAAGSDWSPMVGVASSGSGAAKGTGVFIPPGVVLDNP